MAAKKRKCKHGKTKAGPCRKVPKRRSRKAAKHSKPKASMNVAKRISVVSRKRCGNPERRNQLAAVAKYIGEVGRVEREYGPAVRPIAQVKRNIKALQKTALRLVKAARKCSGRSSAAPEPKRLYRDGN